MNAQFVEGESATSSQIQWSYDVFLSFRGEDTRNTFTGHLYTRLCQVGVTTFIDDEELRKGDLISTKLDKAIEQSRVAIVVFSKNYASSSWCLDELVKILDCRERLNQVVLPIFYDVDPSQVRRQTESFGEALVKHKERSIGAERMEKWKAALTEAANLSGWDLRNVADGHESKFIGRIIKQVLQEVNQTPLDVAHYPIGLDSRIKHIELLLQSGCEHEVCMVGICGVGGIGKTTLAKGIYNRIFLQFGGSCFLSDVRSKVEELGLVKLQEKLLHQILKTKDFEVDSVAEGVNLIKARLGSKKVLIVLDDIDHRSQLESLTRETSWFGSGSVIIITTRDKHLLYGLTTSEIYQAKLLNENEAQQLFACHAFNSLSPPQEYVELVQDIIKYSGGLPLALVTLGSHLQGRSVEEWRYEFKKLRAIPHCDIQKILQISFDGLDDNTQSVFLDIACAFHGCYEDEVTKTLNACGFYSESAISTLVQRNLLQRDWSNLVMHDLVRDMGREIVRRESPRDSGKRSRLFNPQEVRDVLQGNKGSENVEVLVVDRRALKGVKVSTKAFQKMINLRVLKIDDLHISGDVELLSKELRWLSWEGCPLKCIPSNFPAEKLVVLNMKESNIQEFDLNLQYCTSLKKLDLSDCKRLRSTPNFKGSRSLRTLMLQNCSSLKEIHPSIGNLDRLTDLRLYGCEKITDLPSSIWQLKSLEYLNISCCFSLQTLPVAIGEMQSLRHLLASDTGIKELPGSVKMLRNLIHFEVGRSFSRKRVCRIEYLSNFIFILRLPYCGFSEADIPRDIGSLSNLTILDLSGYGFLYLPFDFSELPLLMSLYLNDCENLETLPSVSNLEKLEILELRNCKKLVKLQDWTNSLLRSGST
ncbi:disease resistance protein RUN1-like [Solanum dulcamara]|uniref:disease resistance protein RUN1-like n=1 Tax=Solanum dulcamara TaxID=45834 RepID=UPI0024867792|nr:disease resistance protein RUN1-like [Solanum dulcamara]